MQVETENKPLTKEDFYNKIFSCSDFQQKKELLKELSGVAKIKMELDPELENVNQVLISMYKNNEHTIFKTFHDWKKEGKKVKKGAKCFFIWSKPRKANNKKNEVKKDDKKDEYKFFSLCFLFSNSQVENLKS